MRVSNNKSFILFNYLLIFYLLKINEIEFQWTLTDTKLYQLISNIMYMYDMHYNIREKLVLSIFNY